LNNNPKLKAIFFQFINHHPKTMEDENKNKASAKGDNAKSEKDKKCDKGTLALDTDSQKQARDIENIAKDDDGPAYISDDDGYVKTPGDNALTGPIPSGLGYLIKLGALSSFGTSIYCAFQY
jgi:hypothetical protein